MKLETLKCCCVKAGTNLCSSLCRPAGTIPPIKSPLEKNDDVKKLFSIGCPVILVTVGVALLFIIRRKRKEKRLKRLRGERRRKTERRQVVGMNLATRTKQTAEIPAAESDFTENLECRLWS